MTDTDNALRQEAENLLKCGLKTEVFPRADDHDQVQEIVGRLQTSDGSLEQRLVIGGFTLEMIEHEDIEQACETCMYYLVHRRYCELPELDVPVEAEWSCRLWRI
ncbi:MAG: hypothetical protein JKY32_03565 [Rhizobiales bacterium]|nr:hypothetical protein [Hyphomicrobiales bacterium]